jgi:hypothetical protein
MIAIKSSTTFTANFTNVQFMVQVPNTVSPQPTATILSNPLSTYIAGTYATQAVNEGGYYNYLFSVVIVGGAPFTFNAGTDYNALEIQFGGGPAGVFSDVRLGHLSDGGSTSQLAFFIEMGSDYTNYTNMLYGNGASNGGSYSAYSYVPISNITLPIGISDFKVEKTRDDVLLNWNLQNQPGLLTSFDIERSFDGFTFNKINNVPFNNKYNYSYLDPKVASLKNNGLIYYRLKQIEANNHFDYSIIKSVRLISSNNTILVYPNPVVNIANVEFISPVQQNVTITINDTKGALLKKIQFEAIKGANKLQLNFDQFNAGQYFVTVTDSSNKRIFKMVKN